jgi:RNA polymerase sigma-70 factor, ECF subfamily
VSREQVASPPVVLHSDECLLERIRSGDDEALSLLLRRYGRLAYSIAYRVLRDEGEAEDLVQEIFLRLHAKKSSFDPSKGWARTWIVQMFYRRAFDRRGYLTRRHFYSGTDAHDYANAISGSKCLEEDVIDKLTAQQLRTAFSELTDKQSETLNLFFFEGLTLSEIAELTEEDLKNVRHHYYRGLDKLRQVVRVLIGNDKAK